MVSARMNGRINTVVIEKPSGTTYARILDISAMIYRILVPHLERLLDVYRLVRTCEIMR